MEISLWIGDPLLLISTLKAKATRYAGLPLQFMPVVLVLSLIAPSFTVKCSGLDDNIHGQPAEGLYPST